MSDAAPLGNRGFDTTEDTKLLQKQILKYRRQGWSYQNIADKYKVTWQYISKLHKKALKSIIVDDVNQYRKEQLANLMFAQGEALKAMNAKHLIVSHGHVVRDVVEDSSGNPVLDEQGKPILVKLVDPNAALAGLDRYIKIQDQIAKLLGLNAPTKTALTNPDGTQEAQFVQFYLPSNERESSEQAS